MSFDQETLARHLAGKRIGGLVHFFTETDSTNDVVAAMGDRGAPEGTVVVADRQTKGKGG